MKKMYVLIMALCSVPFYSQTGRVGINTTSPTTTLDINGNARSRNLTGADFSDKTLYPSSVVVTSPNGTLVNANALNILYSSGIYRWSDSNNNWSNIRTGRKEARLELFGRLGAYDTPGISLSILYKVNHSIRIIQNPIMSTGSATISNITSNGFRLTVFSQGENIVFDFTLTTDSNGVTAINATTITPSGNWIQGTWYSIPNLN